MAYTYYNAGGSPQYIQPVYYLVPPVGDARYAPIPEPEFSPRQKNEKKVKKTRRWSFTDGSGFTKYYPSILGSRSSVPPPPAKPRQVLWEADFVRAPVSSRYSMLHPVLAMDTALIHFDLRSPPEKGISNQAIQRFWNTSALIHPTMHMRLVAKDFPWVFELDFRARAARGAPHYVTCGDVWHALHTGLSRALTDSEWSLLVTHDQFVRRKVIERIVASRRVEEGQYARRIDWLGLNVVFRGLTKDESYARNVLLPGREPCPDTFVVQLSAPAS